MKNIAASNGISQPPIVITGGAGFVGTNVAARFLKSGERVRVLDTLARPGVEDNARWLREQFGERVEIQTTDVRDAASVASALDDAKAVFHFAAQVAVTTSLCAPVEDFEINARGTLNVLEALRAKRERDGEETPLFFTSTNKVYGGLEDVAMREEAERYQPENVQIASNGISETRPLDFHSPYGCSKGAADQYVLDYARTFDLPFCSFRMSCIYGPHQKGTEDQGWVAHFLLQTLRDAPLTLYGDGKQVRDLLFIEDLVEAFQIGLENIDTVRGRAFNLGGGPRNALSLLQVVELIEELHGHAPDVLFDDWRPGDQRFYVSDTTQFEAATGWRAQTSARDGIARLYSWMRENARVPAF